jgi:hypothetical protein
MKELYILWALEFTAFLISLVHFKSLQEAGLKFIPILLTVVVLSEALPYMADARGSTRFLYYTLRPLRYICIFLLFRENTAVAQWKNWINGFIGVTVALTALFIFLPASKQLNELSYTIEAVMIVSCCLQYLYRNISGKGVSMPEKQPLLYLALGTLLFYLGTLPLYARYSYLGRHHRTFFTGYGHVSMILAYVMYGLIITGLLRAYYSRKAAMPAG